jgi:Glutaredoxin, GrxC family
MAKVIIYSRDYCPYCTNAIRLLKSKSVDYVLIDITDNPEKRSEMIEKSNRTTVPQIFINGEHVGGFDDLNALDMAGKLDKMLK